MKILKFMLFFLFVLVSISNVSFAEENRWYTILSNEEKTVTLDTKTIQYNKDNNSLLYWIKIKYYSDGITFMKLNNINYELKIVTTENNTNYNQDGSVYFSGKLKNNISNILPDSEDALVANYATKYLNAPQLFSTNNEWIWVMSTDTYTCTINSDSYMNNDNVYIAYIKKTFLDGRQEIEDYQFNFNTNRILSVDGSSDIIIPDSINEKIYNAAYNLYIKNNK